VCVSGEPSAARADVRVKALAAVLGSLLVVACGEAPGEHRRDREVVTPIFGVPGATATPRMQLNRPATIGSETHPAALPLPWPLLTGTGTRVAGANGAAALDVPLPGDLGGARWVAVAIEREPGKLEPVQIATVPPGTTSVRLPYSWEGSNAPKALMLPLPDLTELDVTSGSVRIPARAEVVFYEAINTLILGNHAAPLAFIVTAVEDGRETEVHRTVLDPARRVEDRTWVAQRADLSALAGRTVRFRFAARLADGRPGASLPLWGDPAVHAPKPLATVTRAAMHDLLVKGACLGATAGLTRPDFAQANVLVIGIDTLRADHLGSYGYPRPTSPHIDALAAEGVVFSNAIAQSPWTLPSFASIFTGLLPSVHRAGEGTGLTRSRLDARVPTLATELHRAGWRTGSFVSNGWAGASAGLAESFDTKYEWVDSGSAVSEATVFLRLNASERFFAFVHLIDPHLPYAPGAEDVRPFLDPTYRGPVGTTFNAWPPPADFPAADRQRVIDLYDGEIHVSDRHVGELVELLRELDVLERTIVVVVSDHGEELFDHGTMGHGHTVYDELLHVPLIVRFPHGCWAQRIDAQVRAMDLFPTILDALDLPVPPNLQGMSRMPLVRGMPAPASGDLAIAEFLFIPPEQKAVRRNDLKLIYTPLENATRIFDLATDRREQLDVAAQRSADAASLRTALEREVLRRGEGFQIAARPGREEHQLRLRLESARPFGAVGLVGAEDGKAPVVSNDGRAVEVTLRLPATPANALFVEEGMLRFQVEGDEPFTVQADVDGRALDAAEFFLGPLTMQAEGPAPWTFGGQDDRLVVPFPPELPPSPSGNLRIALYRVRRPPPSAAVLDDTTRERLRQLGYAQ